MSKRNNQRFGSKLQDHLRQGPRLIPPYGRLPSTVELSSWRDERLPECLWAALITVRLDRMEYLALFRELAEVAHRCPDINCDGMGHTRFASLSESQFDSLLEPVLSRLDLTKKLSPLCLFNDLPDIKHWVRHLPAIDDIENAWMSVGEAIAANSWHQSQTATDLRWMKIVMLMASGKMVFSAELGEQAREIAEYPHYGDMRKVRPSIRAAEMAFAKPEDGLSPEWAPLFWTSCLQQTQCMPAPMRLGEPLDLKEMISECSDIYVAVAKHFHLSIKTTDVDERLDASFGFVLYALTLHNTLLSSGSHSRLQGRMFIRTLAEIYITFLYLVKKNSESLWRQYRNYGIGQAKLSFLKLVDLDSNEMPAYVKAIELEQLADEDRWHEFVEIDLGNWAKSDLRKMSEEAEAKAIYDRYYSWPSGYVHAHWGAVRDTVFDLCANPLHRYHRIPAAPRLSMENAMTDGVKLINLILGTLERAYPSFKPRLKIKEGRKIERPVKKAQTA